LSNCKEKIKSKKSIFRDSDTKTFWRQVVLIIVDVKMSSALKKLCQAVLRQVGHIKMSQLQQKRQY